MRAAWIGLLLAALVVLLAAVWLGSLFYWANQHGPEERTLRRHMVRTHELDSSGRGKVQQAMDRGTALDSPSLRAAVLDWAPRALARDVELRAKHSRWSVVVIVLYGVAGACAVAAVVLLLLDRGISWSNRLTFSFETAWVAVFAARPFLRRRNWRRAIERNSE